MINIAVVFADEKERVNWVQALQAAFDESAIEAKVCAYKAESPADTPFKADYAVGWLPPAAFFAAQPQLKAFFNAGAGVDAILRSQTVPADLAIYRLEDAGMGLQMAQYCALECLQDRKSTRLNSSHT